MLMKRILIAILIIVFIILLRMGLTVEPGDNFLLELVYLISVATYVFMIIIFVAVIIHFIVELITGKLDGKLILLQEKIKKLFNK